MIRLATGGACFALALVQPSADPGRLPLWAGLASLALGAVIVLGMPRSGPPGPPPARPGDRWAE